MYKFRLKLLISRKPLQRFLKLPRPLKYLHHHELHPSQANLGPLPHILPYSLLTHQTLYRRLQTGTASTRSRKELFFLAAYGVTSLQTCPKKSFLSCIQRQGKLGWRYMNSL
jgi:hypothetical protein